jgi:hypothetical protein
VRSSFAVPRRKVSPPGGTGVRWLYGMRQRLAPLRLGRLVTPLVFGGGLALVAVRASAGCPVIVTSKDAPKAWVEAGHDAARKLTSDSPLDNDCKEVRVDVGTDETNVTLLTRDARSATRPIRSPDQLVATVSALASTIDVPPVAEAVPPKAPAPTPARAPLVVAPPMHVHLLIHALGGAELGFPGRFSGPQVSLSTGIAFGLAEIGMFGDLTTSLSTTQDTPDGFKMWAIKTGGRGGLRAPAGPVSILAGGLFGVGLVSETAPEPNARVGEINAFGAAVAEPIFGAYAGAAWPNASSLRLRAQLVVDSVLSRPGRTHNLDARLPDLPAWSMSLQIGVEGEPL